MLKKIKTNKKVEEKDLAEVEDIPEDKNQPKIEVNLNTSKSVDLKDLIEKNIKWSQIIYEQNKNIKRRLTLMVIGNYLRLALIIVPIIFALFYLPAFVKNLVGQYSSVLGVSGVQSSQVNELLGNISSGQLQKVLEAIGNY